MSKDSRSRISSPLEQIGLDITGLVTRIDKEPALIEALTDAELLSVDAWSDGTSEVVAAECRRRKAQHEQQARRFTY